MSRAPGRHRPEADVLRQAQAVRRDCLCPVSARKPTRSPAGGRRRRRLGGDMSRIAATFERLQAKQRKALVPYVMAGEPHAIT